MSWCSVWCIFSWVLPQALNDTSGVLSAICSIQLHRRRVIAKHMQARAERDHLDFHLLPELLIMLRNVRCVVQRRFIAAGSFILTCRIKRCVLKTGTARAIAARVDRFRACVVANRFIELLTSHRPCLADLIDPEYRAGVVVIGPEYGAGVVVEYWAGLAVDGLQYGPGLVVFGTQ